MTTTHGGARPKQRPDDDRGGFALSGGGNAQARISAREIGREYPHMIGRYVVLRSAGVITLTKEE